MRFLSLLRYVLPIAALSMTLLFTGCASLQIDVDVYKGPLVHEKEIQVKQYASLAASAKPLLEELYLRQLNSKHPQTTLPVNPVECEKKETYREKSLCEILALFDEDLAVPANGIRSQSRRPERGLDRLTLDVTNAMAQPAGGDRQQKVDEAVAALNEALIFFAQKILYLTNTELLFRELDTINTENGPPLSVLQSLGNTILVHANDLQRQQTQAQMQTRLATSEHESVQRAFQPPPSVTLDAILTRLKRYETSSADEQRTTESNATADQRTALTTIKTDYRNYLATLSTLLAAHRTINAELPSQLSDELPDAVDVLSAQADRKAIATLYASTVLVAPAVPARKPLEDWIGRELDSKAITSPERPVRLQRFRAYLGSEGGLLDASGAGPPTSPAATLSALKTYIAAQVALAATHAQAILGKSGPVQQAIDQINTEEAARIAALSKKAAATNNDAVRAKAVAVVTPLRAEIIATAERIHTRNPKFITSLLLDRLRELARTAKGGVPSADDLQLTIHLIESYTLPEAPCASQVISQECRAATTVEVVDKLISSLRAQRVQAVAAGDTAASNNLLKAINVANDQRTAMIYLRPASDYLRSVYSSSALQEGTESEYRNMLADWIKKYLNPFENDKKNAGRKELEKIHWQNVNKVTVSGGGFTNYVLAKDDVGNWYVKAYNSDPETIIKSATSLALFNSGKSINANLLRRYDAQRMLDEDKTLSTERRAELNKELAAPDWQGGQALLKVRDRYAERYARETAQQGGALLALVNALPATAKSKIALQSDWPGGACTADAAATLIDQLNGTYLALPAARLAKAAATSADLAPGAASLQEMEKSIQAVLTGMHLYSSDVPRKFSNGTDPTCAAFQRSVVDDIRTHVRAQVTAAATARRASIERYEDALSNVLEIASTK